MLDPIPSKLLKEVLPEVIDPLLAVNLSMTLGYTFTFMHLADAFIQSDLQCIQTIHVFVSMCVPWESNPQPFALLTQCSTTEPHRNTKTFKLAVIKPLIKKKNLTPKI